MRGTFFLHAKDAKDAKDLNHGWSHDRPAEVCNPATPEYVKEQGSVPLRPTSIPASIAAGKIARP
jgi:hypothetical protein